MQSRLINELSVVGKRMRSATQMTVLATVWLMFFLVAWALSNGGPQFGLAPPILSLIFLSIGLVFSILFCVISRNWFTDVRWIASRIESHYPELDSRLLTSLDQLEETPERHVGFLQHIVLTQTISHSANHPWGLVVSQGKIVFSQMAAILGFILLLVGSVMLASVDPPPKYEAARNQNVIADEPQDVSSSPIELVEVEPGNTEVEKGTTLTVLAKFKSSIPESAELVYEFVSGAEQETGAGFQRVRMNPSFDDPVYAGQIADMTKPLTYWIEYENQTSDIFYATIFEYPELLQLDFELDFPEYTGLPNKVITDGRRISALKGTRVTFTAQLNKTVQSCQLLSDNRAPIDLQADATGEPIYTAELTVEESAKYRLKLIDEDNRENKLAPEIQINALDNQPPKIKITTPSRDVEVSPLEELQTGAKVSDDYGVHRTGISYSVAGVKPREVELGANLAAKKDHQVEHLVSFEELNVSPKQMVSYFYWAEDMVADGKTRRVMSDMFFAEVREFEQIFRQGQAQSPEERRQQQQQNQNQNRQQQQQMQQLRELQKEIINATWKLIRRETDAQTSENFRDDVGVIQDSQHSALDLVDRAVQQMNSPEAAALGARIKNGMNEVILTLGTARNNDSAEPLLEAVSQEQLVFQMLLKLRSNENDVQQQQQQQSSSSSQQQSRSSQQLQQLELKNDRNRYEQENQAQQRQEQQQSEVRQALNRLKELARRQEDINKQLEQLQTALQEAKSKEEKDEIERRLKRLREQQEELLRDLDELKDEAEQNQDNELMKKATEELDKARENVRKSAEALEKNEVSQAAAAGNRAQKQFEDLREEFKKGNANQFTEEMKEMRDKANDLKTKQDEIAERIRQMDEKTNKSLRDSDDRKAVGEELVEQQKKYDSILEDIKDVVRKAEESEPLLSQQLYDTFRDSSRSPTREALDTTEDLLSRGFISEARKIEQNANEGIEKLNEGIQKAADSIVGDESESLRRAEQTLRKLSNQINNEVEQNNPGQEGNTEPGKNNGQDAGKGEQQPTKNGDVSPGKENQAKGNKSDGKSADAKKSQPGGKSGQPGKEAKQNGKSGSSPSGSKKAQSESEQKSGNQPGGDGKQGQPKQDSKGQNSKGQNSKGQNSKGQGSKSGQPGKQSQPNGKQPGKQNSKQNGKQGGQPGKGGQPGGNSGEEKGNPSDSPSRARPQGARPQGARNQPNQNRLDGYEQMFGGPSNGGAPRPITGSEYRQFSNDLRDIEELLDDPKLRAQAAEIREKAKEIRVEMKRHSKQPNWDVVQEFIAEPLENLREEVARQLLLKENKEALVPIDRDPVPTIFEEQVQEYYKELSEVEK